MKVRRIAPRREREKKKVAAYARVSTLADNQEESFQNQVSYYTEHIRANPAWIFAGVYADQGISGVSAKKRPAFRRMIRKALAGEIDLILVKSISRFSRNVVDCQKTVETLKSAGVEVRFEREGISSFDASSGFIFSLLSAVAQDESRSISENVRWSYQARFARGEYCLGSNRILGYDCDPGTRKLVPNGDAWIIRLVFRLYLEGLSCRRIADELSARGAKTLRGRPRFGTSTIRYILGNETYVGDKQLQKRPPVSHLTKRPDPTLPHRSYYLRGDHEPLIDRDTWERAQAMLDRKKPRVPQN